MRQVDVFFDNKTVFVISSVSTPEGIYVSSDPKLKLRSDDGPLRIGQAIMSCLDHPVDQISYPDVEGRKMLTQDLLRFLDKKSWNQFARSARLVSVSKTKDNRVKIVPHYRGEQSAFFPQPERAILCANAASSIGEAALRLLSTDTRV